MNQLFKIPFLLYLLACNTKKDFKESFNQWKFDTSVIQSLPKYELLKQMTILSIDSFKLSEQKSTFTYIYNFDSLSKISGHSNENLPKSIPPEVIKIINELGERKILGFKISKDSSFEVLIRNTHLQQYFLDVRERLEWKPKNHEFTKSIFPIKDTLLSVYWKYWIWFDKRSEF